MSRRKPWLLLLVFVENKQPAMEAIFFLDHLEQRVSAKNDTRNEWFKGGAQKCRRRKITLSCNHYENHTVAPQKTIVYS